MESEKPKRGEPDSNRTAAYILIGIGILFLLVNVFDINWGRLWPLVLVILGLYLLFGRNNIGSPAKTGYFSAPLGGTKSARVNLHLSVGDATVTPLTGSDKLIDAEVHYVGEIDFSVFGEEEKIVTLRQTSDSGLQWINPATWFANFDGLPWRVGLSPDVPLDLNISGGAGRSELNLHGLNITGVRLQGGVGQMKVSLPTSMNSYDVQIQGGVGETRLDVPADTTSSIKIQGGVGQVVVNTPSEIAMRVRSRGSVSVPSRFIRTAGGDSDFELGKTGTWETSDFASAAHKIEIDYEGGVGALRVS
jgi:Domain of unknown function (DUF5668)/N-terminal domain of toast_rack, DUF2154